MLKRKEKEYHETVEHLQSDMKTLEQEKAELKEKLMQSSKKTLLEGLTKSASPTIGPAPFIQGSVVPSSAASPAAIHGSGPVRDSPLLLKEISHLREALRITQTEKARLLASDLKAKMDSLTPLKLPARKTSGPPSPSSIELNKLMKQVDELQLVRIVQ